MKDDTTIELDKEQLDFIQWITQEQGMAAIFDKKMKKNFSLKKPMFLCWKKL
jgi:hypothetical protein